MASVLGDGSDTVGTKRDMRTMQVASRASTERFSEAVFAGAFVRNVAPMISDRLRLGDRKGGAGFGASHSGGGGGGRSGSRKRGTR